MPPILSELYHPRKWIHILLVEKIIPSFTKNYTQGKISYQDKILTIKGKVKNKTALSEMKKILEGVKIPTKNLSILDEEYLQRVATAKMAEEEAKLEEENRKLQREKLRLEQEEAEKVRLLEEKKRLAIQKAEQEAAEQARLEEEKRRIQLEAERANREKELQRTREAAMKKIAEEKEAKDNILKLLKVENIELSSAFASMFPTKIAHLSVTYSILDPLHVKLNAVGAFGVLQAKADLRERKIRALLQPSAVMRKNYRSALRNFTKSANGEYEYVQSF